MAKITKKAIQAEIRAIVARSGIEKPLIGDDLAYVLKVLQGHPEWESKKGCGIGHLVVRENKSYGRKTTFGFWIIREDDSEVDISWVEALSPTPHPTKVKLAFRQLITHQVHDYRTTKTVGGIDGQVVCESCSQSVENPNANVDHRPPSEFDDLVSAFLTERGLEFTFVEIAPNLDGQIGDRLKNGELAKDWQEWHRERADLWLICTPCHKLLSAARKKTPNTVITDSLNPAPR